MRNWYARFPHITENADNLITNAEEAVEALKTGKMRINVKPRENGRNNFGQQLPTLLDVTFCVRLHNLVIQTFCYSNLTGNTKLEYERKNEEDSGRSSEMTPPCKRRIYSNTLRRQIAATDLCSGELF